MVKHFGLRRFPAFIIIVLIFIAGCKNNSPSDPVQTTRINASGVPLINYSVAGTYPHDTTLFTEGFVYHAGKFYESSGAAEQYPYTNSVVVTDDLQTGKSSQKISIDKKIYFGEGIAFLGDKLYQLTWKNHVGFIYDARTFKQTGTFNYPTEGWSLTTDGKSLIMDDGTDKIYFLDPVKCIPVKTLNVTRDGVPQDTLNELEFIRGYLYANIWHRDEIVKIDTADGKITGRLDLKSIAFEARMRHPEPDENVLNGIAYDSVRDKVYVTGKLWPDIYQINFPH